MINNYEGFMPCCDGCEHTTATCAESCLTYSDAMIMLEEGNEELLEIVNYYKATAEGELPF